jgi:uncharacterized protein (TIGR02646 family)
MKHLPQLLAEPPALTAYRASNPADVAADATKSKDVWDRFRSHEAYKEVRTQLIARQHGLCGYCEQRLTLKDGQLVLSDQQIEHVLPKSGGANRTLDWKNFVLCCGGGTYAHHKEVSRRFAGKANVSCGQLKDDNSLHPGCDPREFPCTPRLVDIALDGTMSANATGCAALGIDPKKLNETINDVLGLNCERLRVARQTAAAQIREWTVQALNLAFDGTYLSEQELEDIYVEMVEGRLRPDKHGHLRAFWTTERQYLEPLSAKWLAQNHSKFGCTSGTCSQVNP